MGTSKGVTPEVVVRTLRRAPGGMRVAELGTKLGVDNNDQYKLRRSLAELIDRGEVERVGRGTYVATDPEAAGASPGSKAVGRISVHPAGYGFVTLDAAGETVFVPAKYRGSAMDGDQVELSTWQGYKGTEGQVVAVVARGRAKLTGTLRRKGRAIVLEPDDPRVATDHGFVPLVDGAPLSQIDQAAVVEICRYPTEAVPEILGRLSRVLGDPDDPRTEIAKILVCGEIPETFPRGTVALAERTPRELTTADFADRVDLRDRPFMTIDPEDARDFDDALCIEDGPRGTTRVWVAVADVSHYVHTDDAIDREAVVRGVSVYLPDRVVPMLPLPLSSGICSLMPDVDRCAMVARLDFTPGGEVRDAGFAAAVIRSHARLDYPGVAVALSGDFRGRRMRYRRHAEALGRLDALARVLRARRAERGALMLEIPEVKVILDEDDPLRIRDVVRAKGTPGARDDTRRAYQLVEEFMIAANEAVGEFFARRDVPTVWRVHAPPEESRLEELAEILAAFGIRVSVEEAATPRGMMEILAALEGRPMARALSSLLLRSLKQAVYSTDPIGHFGLASSTYLHFTSPIRRYPDLLVHRLLKAALHDEGLPSGGGGRIAVPAPAELAELAAAVSSHERRALDAEREAVAMYRAYVMREQIGEEFPGRISAVTSFGAFVELDEPFVEGLIKTGDISDDTFIHDPHTMRLTGKRSGVTLSLGDAVRVRVIDVSVPLRRIDLQLLGVADGAGAGTSRKGKTARRRKGEPKPGSKGAKRGKNKRGRSAS